MPTSDQPPVTPVLTLGGGGASVAALSDDDPAEAYHEASKLCPSLLSRQMAGVRRLERSVALQQAVLRAGKRFPNRPTCALPAPQFPDVPFEQVLRNRRSQRPAEDVCISPAALSALLFAASGVTQRAMQPMRPDLRTAPSAGALYPLDVYVAVRRVEGVLQGLHHYDPDRHALAALRLEDSASHLATVLIDPAHAHAAAWVILAASFQRSRVKYGLRAFRFVLLEAGHIAQNVLLAAAAFNLAALPIGGFFDHQLDAFLRLDGLNESALYLIAVGSKHPGAQADP